MIRSFLIELIIALNTYPAYGEFSDNSKLPPLSNNIAITIPNGTAIVVKFPITIKLNCKKKRPTQITALLDAPIIIEGKELAPRGSFVVVEMQANKNGISIRATGIVINQKVQLIESSSIWVEAESIIDKNSSSELKQVTYANIARNAVFYCRSN